MTSPITRTYYNEHKQSVDAVFERVKRVACENSTTMWQNSIDGYKCNKQDGLFLNILYCMDEAYDEGFMPFVYLKSIDVLPKEDQCKHIYDRNTHFMIFISLRVQIKQNKHELNRIFIIEKDDNKLYPQENKISYLQENMESMSHSIFKEKLFKKGCQTCNSDKKALLRCCKCKIAHYCSKKCQKEDWYFHKPHCKMYSILDNKNIK
jgi:hypothetical protein